VDAPSVINWTVVGQLSWQYFRAPTLYRCTLSQWSLRSVYSTVYSTIPSLGSISDSWYLFSVVEKCSDQVPGFLPSAFSHKTRHFSARHFVTCQFHAPLCKQLLVQLIQTRLVYGSILCDPIQLNPSADWPKPTQPTTSGKIWTQPDPTKCK